MAAIKETLADRVFNAVILVILTLFLLIVAYPLYFIIIASFSDPTLVATGQVLFYPRGLTLDAYLEVFRNKSIWIGYRNTIFYAVGGTLWSLFLTVPAAYALSKKRLRGRAFFMFLVVVPMFFGGGMIPTYLLVDALHLIDTRWSFILPGLVSAWNTFLMRNFFAAIPQSLEESAVLDGATPITVFIRIILPLSKAVIAVIGMYYAVGYWNSWFPGVMYINNPDLLPMQNVMRNILAVNSAADVNMQIMEDLEALKRPPMEGLRMAAIVVGTLPILVVYPFIQKYFVKGVMIGSIKG